MQRSQDTILLSATDLAGHLACRHLTQLELRRLDGELERPMRHDPVLETLIERGNAHEASYVEFLRQSGRTVVDLRIGPARSERTLAAMREGVDVITQAELRSGQWHGFADLLLKTDEPSELGDWSYEVADTKLARNTRPGTVLQLCLYSDLVACVQGTTPQRMYVVKAGDAFDVEELRFDDFGAYYRMVKSRLERVLAAGKHDQSYPDPVPHCEVCSWWPTCNQRRRDDDHLSFVAGIGKQQIAGLADQNIGTLEQLAIAPEVLTPKRGSLQSLDRVRLQAKIQHKARQSSEHLYEFLSVEEGKGFCRLPEPAQQDVFFDIEGDPHVPGGGLEYLLGYVTMSDAAEPEYADVWGLNRDNEKVAFERFIDYVMDRWRSDPAMHIYHYAPYEPSAIKRLATRHATREDEVDRLLRAGKFIDLYAIVRQGIRASVESYSIKKLEPFYGYQRLEELNEARHALNRLERALELGLADEVTETDRRTVGVYNQDDCLSTLALRDWLEGLRAELIASGEEVTRPPLLSGDSTNTVAEQEGALGQIVSALTDSVDDNDVSMDAGARRLLVDLLPYFRREDKCSWWEFFRLQESEPDELFRERHAVIGLEFRGEIPAKDRRQSVRHRYSFPPQEVSIDTGDELFEVGGEKIGTVTAISVEKRIVEIRPVEKAVGVRPSAVFAHTHVPTEMLQVSLLAFGNEVAIEHGQGRSPRNARYDLLSRRRPRLKSEVLPQTDQGAVNLATSLARDLDMGVLPIQGPPGAGKTHLGSRVISTLAKEGKRIGITAVSHKVIRNMLTAIRDAPEGTGLQLAHKFGNKTIFRNGIEFVGDVANAVSALDEGKILGGTAWLWANQKMAQKLDYLFIDEAGQMALAMALAAGQAAKNIVLLGDPQQLEQPQRGSHPGGADVSVLKHLIGEAETIDPERGLFLDRTWRLHPDICKFTSELYYDNRLASRTGLEAQAITGPSRFVGNGLKLVPVEHSGNQARSDEEVRVISKILDELLVAHTWQDRDKTTHPISDKEILIVAPYNAQVAALRKVIGDRARIGTVDKFQGQEAPIVIYSMTSSSAEDSPRGMEFLFSPNRLNVATSRARCLVIVVGCPELLTAECLSVHQMRKANGVCRYAELAVLDA